MFLDLAGPLGWRDQACARLRTARRAPDRCQSSGTGKFEALSTALATFGKAACEAIDEAERFGDADTADVFTKISRETDKQLWLVEAHLYS
jgi:DNA-binding ferritin-like protein